MYKFLERCFHLVSAALVLLAASASGTALAVSEACERDCGRVDLPCQDLERKCELKLNSYRTFMDQIGFNVTLHSLPALYVELLRPHYPGVDLSTVRFGFSRGLARGAMTDCDKIYFADESYVDKVRNGTLGAGDEPGLLYHELTHTEQCAQRGGRDFYAVMWWNELTPALIQAALQGTLDPGVVHDLMPMEEDANGRESDLCTALPDGLVRAVSISAFTPSTTSPQPVNNTITWTAQASGGRGTIELAFDVRRAGTLVADQPFGSGSTFSWTPAQEGVYVVRARARQASPQRGPVQIEVPFVIAGAGGGGGAPFSIACEEGAVLVGLTLHTSSYVDYVQAICARINRDGSWRTREINGRTFYWLTTPGSAGGAGGAAQTLRCAPGEGVMEVFGRSGTVIDRLGIRCGRLGPVGEGTGIVAPRSVKGPSGGPGGAPFELWCPANQVVTSIEGRSGRYVDQIAVRCPNLCLDAGNRYASAGPR